MNVEIHLNNGEIIIESVSNYDKERILESLNNIAVLHVVIGEMIVNKHMVQLVRPEVQNG